MAKGFNVACIFKFSFKLQNILGFACNLWILWQFAAGALIQTNTLSFFLSRIFLVSTVEFLPAKGYLTAIGAIAKCY